ncbi:MAG: hypothetical protein QXT38_01875 [Candidatus Aenigmatarchaeota archaeon]
MNIKYILISREAIRFLDSKKRVLYTKNTEEAQNIFNILIYKFADNYV